MLKKKNARISKGILWGEYLNKKLLELSPL